MSQGLLVALETPRSPRGLHLLARHSESFASSLLQCISSIVDPKEASAASQPASTEVAQNTVLTQHNSNEGLSEQPQLQESTKQSLHANLLGTQHQQKQRQQTQNVSRSSSSSSSSSRSAAEAATAVATALRCLESMVARDSIFTLPPPLITQALFKPALVFASANGRSPVADIPFRQLASPDGVESRPTDTAVETEYGSQTEVMTDSGQNMTRDLAAAARGSVGNLHGVLREGAGVFVGCCSLIMAGLRHHARAVRRCMALVGASTRALLTALMRWSQPQTSRYHLLYAYLIDRHDTPSPVLIRANKQDAECWDLCHSSVQV